MTQLIKSLRWDHAKKSLHIGAHVLLFFWIVSLAIHTKEWNNQSIIYQYIAVAALAIGLYKVNQNILKD